MTAPLMRFEIAHFEAGSGLGRIGIVPCPGQMFIRSCGGMPRPVRSLSDDLCQIKKWGAVAVVSVLEKRTMDQLEVPDLGEAVQRQGMEWLHFPVQIGNAPNISSEKIWSEYGPRLRTILEQGQNVLLHSVSRRGRSAMMAARILVELGWGADNAIAEVRRVWRGAIERPAQEAVIRAVAAGWRSAERTTGDVVGIDAPEHMATGSARKPKLPRSLRKLDKELDLPMEGELRILHSEELPKKERRRLFSHTAEALLRPLSEPAEYDPSYLEEKLGLTFMGGELSRFRYVYVFDRGYRFQLHLDALDASEEAVKCVSVVSRSPQGRFTGVAEILRIRDREELTRLAEISPFFEWTAKASRGQHFGQTWAYFFGQMMR